MARWIRFQSLSTQLTSYIHSLQLLRKSGSSFSKSSRHDKGMCMAQLASHRISAEIVARPALTPSIHEEPMNPARLIRLVESWEVSRRERTPQERSFMQISRLPSKAS